MYRNDYRGFAGPLLPFVGGILVGGILGPRPSPAPYPPYPPYPPPYYGPPHGGYPVVTPIYGPVYPIHQPNMTQNINPIYSNSYPTYPINQDIYLINEPTIRPSVHDN